MARTMSTLFALAALLAASTASAASPPPAVASPPPAKPAPYCTKTFTLATVSSVTYVKLSNESRPGDSFGYSTPFFFVGETEPSGYVVGTCTFLDVSSANDTTSLCGLTFLPFSSDTGYVTTTGVVRSAASSISYTAITGGTQWYRSASGQVKVDVSADQAYSVWQVSLDKAPSCPPGA